MKKLLCRGLCAIVASATFSARATVVQYELGPLGGDAFSYIYSVTNDGSLGGGTIDLFDVRFDPFVYDETSLTIATPAPLADDWDELLLSSVPGESAAYDALALAGGIAVGQSAVGFTVRFLWLGTATPGSQPFVIYDPVTFEVLEEGMTVPAVPLPAAGWLLIGGVAALASLRRRKGSAPR
jgi:hypothetical protein